MNKLYKENPFIYNLATAKGLNNVRNTKLLLSASLTYGGVTMLERFYNSYESMLPRLVVSASIGIIGTELVSFIYDILRKFKSQLKLIELGDALKREDINIDFLELIYDDKVIYLYDEVDGFKCFIIENDKQILINNIENKKVFYIDKEKDEEKEITNLVNKTLINKK